MTLMRATTVTTTDYSMLEATDPGMTRALDIWLGEIIGRAVPDAFVVEATLGEGTVEVVTVAQPVRWDVDGNLGMSTARYPAPVPPPCWPAGCSRSDAVGSGHAERPPSAIT